MEGLARASTGTVALPVLLSVARGEQLMALDKRTAEHLERFAQAFREARERGATESDTVMYLVRFFDGVEKGLTLPWSGR